MPRQTTGDYTKAWWAGFKFAIYDYSDDGKLDGARGAKMDAVAAHLMGEVEAEVSASADDVYRNSNGWKAGYAKGLQFVQLYQAGAFEDLHDAAMGTQGTAGDYIEDAGQFVAGVANDPLGTASGIVGDLLTVGADIVGAESFTDEIEDFFGN